MDWIFFLQIILIILVVILFISVTIDNAIETHHKAKSDREKRAALGYRHEPLGS